MVKFSVIILINNSEKFIRECLDSVINQTLTDIEIIGIDLNSQDKSLNILKEYADNDNRIKIIDDIEDWGAAKNKAIELAQGEFITFVEANDKLTVNALDSVYGYFKKNDDIDVVAIPIFYFDDINHDLNHKFDLDNDKSNKTIDLTKNPDFLQANLCSSFLRRDSINDLRFESKLRFDDDLLFMSRFILPSKKIGLVKNVKYYLRRSNMFYIREILDDKNFYTPRLDNLNGFIESVKDNEGNIPTFIESAMAYSLKPYKEVSEFPDILNDDEIGDFFNSLDDLLDNISEDMLLNPNVITNRKQPHYAQFLLYLKNRRDFNIDISEGTVLIKTKDYIINNFDNRSIYFDIVEFKGNHLNLSGNFVSSCMPDKIRIEAIKSHNGKKETYKAVRVEYPNTPREIDSYLGIDWRYNYNFEFKIPVDKNGVTNIRFLTIYEENDDKMTFKSNIKFRVFAELSAFSHYYIRNSKIISFVNNSINIAPYKYSKALRLEVSAFKKILTSDEKFKYPSIFYRLMYLLFLPIMRKKKIFLFMDRRDNTGDNGEHLFRYAIEQKDDITKYFAVEKSCNEYDKLKKEYGKNILEFGSFKHKFIYMFVDKVISSQGYKRHLSPFADYNLRLVEHISTPPVYFLQHGVGKYDMTNWLRKYDINFSLILTVSDYDQKAFVETYNYDEEIIQELGFPRYDNLTNDNLKKEIVIIPTWRKSLKTEIDMINSEYFERWNSLLNNKELIEYANKKGYKIVYKPHPNSLKFLDLFDTDDVVVDTTRRFHEILCESALMITDYSSVNFDFAYLKKPIVYYQYGDDGNFGESLIDEDVCTFGEIIDDENVLVDKIKGYLDNDCKMEDSFIDKVNNFFKFTDKNNSKRVYDWILKH